ncbi:MAG TPA: malto-oligosyltrehalose synthase [Candidatus Cybelea sp.]|nr:malto-oligosyltrehalose synthase [Candidatus Cybelea sp.]
MRVPSATYRIQFHLNFRFSDAEQIVPFLHEMGISHLYASPRGKARKGSLHGYDVADPMRINSELGTEEEFTRLVERLHKYDMGLLLDIVPNHMAASSENPWWMDVLENGLESPYASYFDIDWDAPGAKSPELEKNRIVLPILTDRYDRVLFAQGIALRFDEKGFYVEAETNRVPVNPSTYDLILVPCLERIKSSENGDLESCREFEGVLKAVLALASPPSPPLGVEKPPATARAELKARLWALYLGRRSIRRAIDDVLRALNGTKGNPASFERLDALLWKQSYRLANWHTAAEEVNYRRFFGLNDLVAVKVEDPRVFEATHALIFRLIAEGKVDGLRVDHIDGLLDPEEYLERLQNARRLEPGDDSSILRIYTIVEKITSGAEELPKAWRAAGTTGYDFLNAVNALFVDSGGWNKLQDIYRAFTGVRSYFSETWYVRKRQVMEDLFGSDIHVLSSRLGSLAARDPRGRDLPMPELIRALKEITARLAVYRTYLRELELPETDRACLHQAIKVAQRRRRGSGISEPVFDFLRRLFLLDPPGQPVSYGQEWLDFLLRWQQLSGAVMAKGLEDTAFFVHHGLLSLNEVGANPFRKGIRFGLAAFHDFNRERLCRQPHTLNTTSTHDTKWSEDVRARINVLSEVPEEWEQRLDRWSRWNRANKAEVEGRLSPSPNEEVLLYQALLGIWPLGEPNLSEIKERLGAFLVKAVREAKTHSNWTSPNEPYEGALREFVNKILEVSESNPFLSDFLSFFERIAPCGASNAYAQLLLKMTSPGIPDFYQGNELWQFRLTDPDNRSNVDFRQRARTAEELSALAAEAKLSVPCELLENWRDGRLKLYLTAQVLDFRRAHKDLFSRGDYLPLYATGAESNFACCFARRYQKEWAMVAVPRLATKLVREGPFPVGQAVWSSSGVDLPRNVPSEWVNLFTSQTVRASSRRLELGDVFAQLPFALLTHEANS